MEPRRPLFHLRISVTVAVTVPHSVPNLNYRTAKSTPTSTNNLTPKTLVLIPRADIIALIRTRIFQVLMSYTLPKFSVKPWTRLSDRLLKKTFAFDLRARMMRSPDGSYEGDFFYLECPNWANVVGLTEKNEVILVEQFRHGIAAPTLEAPGGILDPHETDPQTAAMREMEEETGYVSDMVEPLGVIHPNPAILTNSCHLFLARNCRKTKAPELDAAEDILMHLVPLSEIPELIATSQITHTISLNALCLMLLRLGGLSLSGNNR